MTASPAQTDACASASRDSKLGSVLAHSRRIALAALAALLLVVVAVPATALGAQTRNELSTFDGSDSDAGAFSFLRKVAVHQDTGTVYALDGGGGVVDRFDASGTAQDFSALGSSSLDGNAVTAPDGPVTFALYNESDLAVDNSGTASDGNLVVVSEPQQTAWVFDETGAYLHRMTGFGDPCGAAVDSEGHVWIADNSARAVIEYDAAGVATGNSVGVSGTGPFGDERGPCHMAFDSSDNLYVALFFGAVHKYDTSGAHVAQIDPEYTTSVAVDRSTDQVYATHPGSDSPRVSVYDAAGAALYDFSEGTAPSGVAINEAADEAYVSSFDNTVHVFGPPVVVAEPTTSAASDVELTSATLNGSVNLRSVELTDCHFEYGVDNSYGDSVPCVPAAGSIPADDDEHAVSADVSGLSRSTTYHFRLVTTNANGATAGDDVEFTTRGAAISGVGTQSVDFDTATVAAKINPNGEDTTYHVEYGTDTSYGQSTPESASIGSDTAAHPVSTTLTGLAAGTTYHWRIVATSAADIIASPDRTFTTHAAPPGSASCPNDRYRTGPAAGLPDCRAYEMVSPVDKNNGDIATIPDFISYRPELSQSSVDGSKLTYSSYKAFGDALGAPLASQYIASRGAGGWSSHGLDAPRDTTVFGLTYTGLYELLNQFKAFTPDLSTAWVTNDNETPLTADAVEGIPNLYKRNNLNDTYSAVTINEPPIPPSTFSQNIYFDGFSSDTEHVVFSATMTLTDDAADIPFTPQAYELFDGELRLVSVLPDGTAAPGGGIIGRSGIEHDRDAALKHAISEDGSRIFWTAWDTNALYVRIDGERTVNVSPPSEGGYFRIASADGSKAIYSTSPEPTSYGDLYEFDVDSETRTLIARDSRGLMGASDDLSHLYFSSREDLAAGASAGEDNLYLERDDEITFVAGLSAQDVGEATTHQGAVDSRPTYRASRVTPDGRHIVFQSNRSVTGYDNTDAVTGQPDVEVFTYDADADRVTCVSCNSSGARPAGDTLKRPYTAQSAPLDDDTGQDGSSTSVGAAAWIPAAPTGLYAPRTLLDDGSRVFFNSYDALVAGDTNGKQDVYQWVRQGSGGCQKADGCVSLISTGTSPQKSEFTDASADGRDVFFHTASSLVAQDTRLIDIYDARIGGGFDPPPAMPDGCDGESCQGASGAPADTPPASANGGSANSPVKGKAARARVRIVGKAVNGAGFSLRVRVSGKGVISGGGSGLRSVSKRVGKAGTYRLAFKLTAKARRTLARKNTSRVRARVRFVASGGKASRATVVLTVKQPKQAHGTRAAKNNSGGAK